MFYRNEYDQNDTEQNEPIYDYNEPGFEEDLNNIIDEYTEPSEADEDYTPEAQEAMCPFCDYSRLYRRRRRPVIFNPYYSYPYYVMHHHYHHRPHYNHNRPHYWMY